MNSRKAASIAQEHPTRGTLLPEQFPLHLCDRPMQPSQFAHVQKCLWRYGKASFCVLLLLILATGCSAHFEKRQLPEWSKTGPAAPLCWSDHRAPELEPLVSKHCAPFLEKGKSIGLAVAVISGSNSTIMTFGRASLFSDQPLPKDTLFEIGSITKTFTALALAEEIQRGKLSLNDPIQGLMPAGLQLPKEARPITLKHLTTHTSGFPRLPDNMSFWHSFRRIMSGGNPYDDYSEAQFLEAIRTVDLDFKPGTKIEYSNFGMDVLGYLLSAKAGTNYEAYITREVCEPLGLHDTTVTLTTNQAARFAQGYSFAIRKGAVVAVMDSDPWDLPNHLAGSGALRSTVADMLKYLELNMHPAGSLGGAIRASHSELFRENDDFAVGMNWVRSSSKSLGTVIWHNGAMGGASSYLGFTEDGRVGVVVLSNVGSDGVDDLAWAILREFKLPATVSSASDHASANSDSAHRVTNAQAPVASEDAVEQ
jgi:CubicO group peptidase (beta-lactamase class C family)